MINLIAWLFDMVFVAIDWIFPNSETGWFEA